MHCIVCDLKSDRGLKVEPQKIRFFFLIWPVYTCQRQRQLPRQRFSERLPWQNKTAKMAKFGHKICLFWCNFWLNLGKIMGLFNTIFFKNIFLTGNWPKIDQFQAHFQLNICPSLKLNNQIHFILWQSLRKKSIFVFWLCRFCRFCHGKCVLICQLPRQRKLAAKRHVQAGFHSTVKN